MAITIGQALSIPELVDKQAQDQINYIERLTVREYVELLEGLDEELSRIEEWKLSVIRLKQVARAVTYAKR